MKPRVACVEFVELPVARIQPHITPRVPAALAFTLTLSPFAYSLIFCLVFFEFRKIEFGSV